jgi:hypothetical protein
MRGVAVAERRECGMRVGNERIPTCVAACHTLRLRNAAFCCFRVGARSGHRGN